MLHKKTTPPASATPAPGGTPAVEDKPGVLARPLDPEFLARLGFELYASAAYSSLRLYETNEGFSIEYWFPVADPPRGAAAGLLTRFKTIPGNPYYLQAELYNGYNQTKYPKRIVHKIALEGMTVEARDIAQPPQQAWRPFEFPFTAIEAQTDVAVFLEVVGDLESWNWGYACRAIARNIRVIPAWSE